MLHLVDKPLGVFRPGELLFKIMQAKACVDALLQNTPQPLRALKDNDALHAAFLRAQGRRHTGGASADHYKIILQHM